MGDFGVFSPLTIHNRIHEAVPPAPFEVHVLTKMAFTAQAQLLEDMGRGGVVRDALRPDTVQAQTLEAETSMAPAASVA